MSRSSFARRVAEMEARERIIWMSIRPGETRAQALARRFPGGRPPHTDLIFLSYQAEDEPDDPPPDQA